VILPLILERAMSDPLPPIDTHVQHLFPSSGIIVMIIVALFLAAVRAVFFGDPWVDAVLKRAVQRLERWRGLR
jgi:hypothetical protein